jgi:hypothetical protein
MKMSDLTKPLSEVVAEWRRRALAGEFTDAEYKEILSTLRSGRISVGKAAVTKRSSKEPIDTAKLMGELDDIPD